MQISQVKNAIFVGEVIDAPKEYSGTRYVRYNRKLAVQYDSSFPKHLKTKHVSMVYMITIDDVIYKIGQSSAENGISGCMNFYMSAGQDDPGQNRFTINYLIREQRDLGKIVKVHFIYKDPIQVVVPGLNGEELVWTPVSAKSIEQLCLRQYRETEDNFPIWNFQEKGEKVPQHIEAAFADYKKKRSKKN
jgi:hypothetical protein